MSNAIGTVTAKVVADTRGFKKGINSSVADMRKWQRSAKQIFESTRTPVERFKGELANINALHKKGHIDATTHARAVKMLNTQYAAAPGLLSKAASSMLTMLGPLAAVGAVFKMGRLSEDINRAMHSSLAIMGKVSQQMRAEMKETANQVAYDTVFSMAEASKAYYFLASAGLDAAQSLKALPTVAKFAQAGMFDLSTATDLLTDAQMALGLSSKDAQKNLVNMTHVGDVLVKANTIANASVRQFSESLTNKAAAAARRFGKDIEEVTATLAVFASRGIKGAEAGTQYDIVLRHLSIKAIENAAAFKKAGVAVYGADKQMRNLADIVGDLEGALAGMGAEQQVATLMSLGFTAKTIGVLNALMDTSDGMREFEEELRKAGGTMEEVAGKQMTEFQEGWEKITASISAAANESGGALDSMGRGMTVVSERFTQMGATARIARENIAQLNKEAFGGEDLKAATAMYAKFKEYMVQQGKLPGAQTRWSAGEWSHDLAEFAKRGGRGLEADAGRARRRNTLAGGLGMTANEQAAAAAAEARTHLADLAEQAEAAKKIADDFVKSLQFRIDTSGMDSYEKALFKLEQQYEKFPNIDKSRLEEARRLTAELKAQEVAVKEQAKAVKEQQTTMRRGAAIAKSMRTPNQVLKDTIADLKQLRAVGAIDAATYARAWDKAQAGFSRNAGSSSSGAPAPLRDTAQARQSFVTANDPLLQKADERNRILRDIDDGIKGIQQPQVADL